MDDWMSVGSPSSGALGVYTTTPPVHNEFCTNLAQRLCSKNDGDKALHPQRESAQNGEDRKLEEKIECQAKIFNYCVKVPEAIRSSHNAFYAFLLEADRLSR